MELISIIWFFLRFLCYDFSSCVGSFSVLWQNIYWRCRIFDLSGHHESFWCKVFFLLVHQKISHKFNTCNFCGLHELYWYDMFLQTFYFSTTISTFMIFVTLMWCCKFPNWEKKFTTWLTFVIFVLFMDCVNVFLQRIW